MLDQEVTGARQTIIKDGFDMSFGELIRIYERQELIIHPEYQRLFRWEQHQKTAFIESILLGIPLPPIFVFTNELGRWELIDGLQRLSTVFQFAGILRDPSGALQPTFVPDGTRLLPSLKDAAWDESKQTSETIALPMHLRLEIERTRLRVEILKRESSSRAKFELFQRLNTGGSHLSEQEVRSCVLVMVNPEFHRWVQSLATNPSYVKSIGQTERARSRQYPQELVIRFLSYRYADYDSKYNIHEFLDQTSLDMASDSKFTKDYEGEVFRRTFEIIEETSIVNPFSRWDGARFTGASTLAAYEVATNGIAANLTTIDAMPDQTRSAFVIERLKNLWSNEKFLRYTGAGVKGTSRLAFLLPEAPNWFAP
ncbi:DUF262 domain-containing protein [Sorangium sp. So ce362]|uniref:DUF262 domain-containing protein n=1 Tax=Sorangium sp. So ce362 TaxID=3133303 RepID=UPI003F6236E4